MAKIKHNALGQAALVFVACVLGCIGIAACGGSSKDASSSTTNTNTSTSTTSTVAGGGQAGAGAGRFAAVRSCLQKEGINLPAHPAGQRPPGAGNGGPPHGGGFPGGGPSGGRFAQQLPKGVSREKLTKALSKCGAHFGTRREGFFHSSKAKAALTKFSQCMSEHGVKLPAPNTSGHGPVFDTKGINTASSKFKDAEAKCQTQLPGRFGHGGAPPPPGQSQGA